MHVVPNYDDGAKSLEEAIKMLRLSSEQGVADIFCTSHNGYTIEDGEKYQKNFALLKERVLLENLNVRLHKGCEILSAEDYIEDILYGIEIGVFSTLGETKYVLIELYPDSKPSEATSIVKKVIDKGYIPIIAHMERNYNLSEMMIELMVKIGALIQVNVFSFVEEKNLLLQERARNLLKRKLIHFIGSDAHGIDHRPPRIISGVEYILDNVDKEYALEILSENANKLLLKRG